MTKKNEDGTTIIQVQDIAAAKRALGELEAFAAIGIHRTLHVASVEEARHQASLLTSSLDKVLDAIAEAQDEDGEPLPLAAVSMGGSS